MDVILWLFRLTWLLLRGIFRLLGWLLGVGIKMRRSARKKYAFGSSRFASTWELVRAGVLGGTGPVLGKGPFGRIIKYTSDGIVHVFASTGSGKGLGIVTPTLLSWNGSVVITDPKSENYDITHRCRSTFSKIRMLNPVNLSSSDRFNPIDLIRRGTDMEADDAKALAQLMVKPDGKDSHWREKSISLATCLILRTLAEPEETRNLAHVRALSVGGPETFRATLEEIANSSSSLLAAEIASGFLAQIPQQPTSKAGEFESILSTLQKATEPWSAGSPAGKLSAYSTFSLDELTTDVCSLYLCVDEELLGVYELWLRVMVGCTLNALMRAKHRPQARRKVLLLLDEVAVLGPLDPLEKQSGLLRAYCLPLLIWQSLPQARSVYGEAADAFLANASCRVFFGVNDNQTATYVATMLGNTTTLSSSHGVSQSSDAWLRHQHQHGQAESGYWLLDPAEVQRLPVTRAVIKMRDVPFPIMAKRLDYRRVGRWRGQWDAWRGQAR